MGCGKSKKGRKVANYLGLRFIDMDEWIENSENKTIPEIFAQFGEDYFRQKEYEALLQICEIENTVVACGGGSPCYFNAIDKMNDNGITVYLKASPAFLKDRLMQSKKKRPLIENLSTEELLLYIEAKLKEREAYYEKAKLVVEAVACRSVELADTVRSMQRSA